MYGIDNAFSVDRKFLVAFRVSDAFLAKTCRKWDYYLRTICNLHSILHIDGLKYIFQSRQV